MWYKELKDGEKRDKMETPWREGVWLGHSAKSTEYGVVRAWCFRRRPLEEQWNGENIKKVRGTPAQPVPGKPGDRIPIKVRFDEVGNPDFEERVERRKEVQPRKTPIKQRHYGKYGYTVGCEGCDRMRSKMSQRPHNAGCRTRMETAIENDPDEEDWLDRAKRREEEMDQKVADAMEQLAEGEREPSRGAGQAHNPREAKTEDEPMVAEGEAIGDSKVSDVVDDVAESDVGSSEGSRLD